jgi:hypothetical protein
MRPELSNNSAIHQTPALIVTLIVNSQYVMMIIRAVPVDFSWPFQVGAAANLVTGQRHRRPDSSV